jgi:hypothetical protein
MSPLGTREVRQLRSTGRDETATGTPDRPVESLRTSQNQPVPAILLREAASADRGPASIGT